MAAFTIDDYRFTTGWLLASRPWQLQRLADKACTVLANPGITYRGLTRTQTVTAARLQLDDALFALSLKTA